MVLCITNKYIVELSSPEINKQQKKILIQYRGALTVHILINFADFIVVGTS